METINSVQGFIEKYNKIDGCIAACLTDEYIIEKWPIENSTLLGKEEKVLEIRFFNKDMEAKLFRTDISRDFGNARVIDDNNPHDSHDEEQYLDIDTTKDIEACDNGMYKVKTMAGGTYMLPFDEIVDAKVKIRYYIEKYEMTGQARISDWRIVEFIPGKKLEEGGNNNGKI